jgi:hypothetical protein
MSNLGTVVISQNATYGITFPILFVIIVVDGGKVKVSSSNLLSVLSLCNQSLIWSLYLIERGLGQHLSMV